MANVVITGAAGFIGSHLVDRLLLMGHDVVGIDSFTEFYESGLKEGNLAQALRHPRFRLVRADLVGLDWRPFLPIDVVFHLAAQPGVRQSWGDDFELYVRRNLEATRVLVEQVLALEVRRLVLASTSSVYGDAPAPMREDGPHRPLSPYGVTKLAAEHLARAYARGMGLELAILRYFTVYGPRQRPDMAFHRFFHAILADQPIMLYGDGSQRRDFTYVDDVIDANVAAMDAPLDGIPINIGGGSCVTLAEAIAVLERVTGKSAQVRQQPTARGDAPLTLADITRARALLAYQPKVSLEEGLRRELQWIEGSIL